jgi:hypothetical protein
MKTKKELIFQALGAASMCWSELPKGVFESSRCKQIGKELIAALKVAEALKPSHNTAYTAALERIIKWALGERGNFRMRDIDKHDGPYYWRTELRQRLNNAKKRYCVSVPKVKQQAKVKTRTRQRAFVDDPQADNSGWHYLGT